MTVGRANVAGTRASGPAAGSVPT